MSVAPDNADDGEEACLTEMRNAYLQLPQRHRDMLSYVASFLSDVASKCELNMMSTKNLAVCFQPSLFGIPHSVDDVRDGESLRVKLVTATEALVSNPDRFR